MGDQLWSTNSRINYRHCVVTPKYSTAISILHICMEMFSRVTIQLPMPFKCRLDKVAEMRHQMEGRVIF